MTKTLSRFLLTITVLFSLPLFVRSQTCDNWLYCPPGAKSRFTFGDLDVPGNKITVEATFCRTTPIDPLWHGGDLVTKYYDQFNDNYLLRANLASITTDAGYFEVLAPCSIQLNVTYHQAMVYDGSTLSLYRNGTLIAQKPAHGNLFQQDLIASAGYYTAAFSPPVFEGYINEVRIWNVARTQAEIQANMSTSLTNPTTQSGLLAYYTFDNTSNKQGNATWNGVLENGALINQTNPHCNPIVLGAAGLTGTITGSNTCNGAPGLLTFHSQTGPGPFTVVYSDGTNTYTATNVMDGAPFNVQVQPTVSTTYTLISVTDGTSCPIPAVPGTTATINPGNCNLCTGSLGDPLINATFGSGTGNAPSLGTVIPGASTSLQFQPTNGSPPTPTPVDGYYTICNAVPANTYAPVWFSGAKDHTGDPNGYMLFENPDKATGEFYRQKLTTLCGGGKYEFAAWFAQVANPAVVPNLITPDLTFIVQTEDGTVLNTYNTGPVPVLPSFTWNKYGFFFTLPPGITTAVVRILDNVAGGAFGNGNDFAIDDITFRPCGPDMTAVLSVGQPAAVCPGATISLNGTIGAGYTSPAYLWQISADSGKTWTDVPGANSTTLTVIAPSPGKDLSYHYRMLAAEGTNISSPSCRVASNDVVVLVSSSQDIDFGYTQDPCNPLDLQFSGAAAAGVSYTWTIDGTDYAPAGAGDPTLSHTFPDYGDYAVTLKGLGSCTGSTTKTITVALTPAEILLTSDSNICIGKSVTLKTKPSLKGCWSPTTGLSDPSSSSPTVTPTVTTKYHYTALVTGANLVINGDFSSGNTGFTSDYTFTTNGFPVAMYGVGPDPSAWLPNAPACKDHTSGAGNMLFVNGAQQPDVRVWSQKISVQPNTDYAFSAWLENITTVNPAMLQFSINGQRMGSPLTANVNDCIWDLFHTIWNSGTATTAVLSIVNENTVLSGNDFALDDIAFAPVTMQTDSVTIDVETPNVTAAPLTLSYCPNTIEHVHAQGALTYVWAPAMGLDDPNIADPQFILPPSAVAQTVQYTVTGTTARGCNASATINLTRAPALIRMGPANTVVCTGDQVQLSADGGLTYNWTSTSPLNDPTSANPIAILNATTKFYLSIRDNNGCPESDSLIVSVRPKPLYKAPPDRTICYGFDVPLASANGPGYRYEWTPADGLSDPIAPVPVAKPLQTTDYTLHISDSVCAAYDSSFLIAVTVRPSPTITAEKDNDIDCAIHTTQLRAGGGLSYQWSPATGLSTAFSPAPIASVDTTTTYIVKGTGSNGCYAFDTLTVYVTATGANTFVVPNAFTPNGDGHNDCFGVRSWGDVRLEELAIYDRLGVRVFSTRNPSDCWDGTFHGQTQPTGAYVYIIRAHTFCGEITRTGTLMLVR